MPHADLLTKAIQQTRAIRLLVHPLDHPSARGDGKTIYLGWTVVVATASQIRMSFGVSGDEFLRSEAGGLFRPRRISRGTVDVWVIPTNEEWEIARMTDLALKE